MIKVSDFSKCYDQELAVQGISFCVNRGEVLGLVGRNGAGKTTTLRAITGIIPPSAGTIEVEGFSIAEHVVELKQRTAYVPDDPQLFEDLSVLQHLQFQASVYGIADPADHIAKLLAMFELESKRHSRADSLSRGMRQKLAICCAYLQRPKALLLDEPMTGLDPQGIRMLKRSVKQQADQGAAVIISSHLLAMVEDICSHVLVLDRGRCKFFGTLDQLQTEFVGNQTGSLEDAFFSALGDAQEALASELSGGQVAGSWSEGQTACSLVDSASKEAKE